MIILEIVLFSFSWLEKIIINSFFMKEIIVVSPKKYRLR